MTASAPALACSYAQAPEEVGDTSGHFFARLAIQAIELDIWPLNGGNGNRQGTLPEKQR